MASIYLLKFPDESIYVGQTTVSPQARFNEHCRLMMAGTHHSYKVQLAYDAQGLPELIIIEEVPIAQLNEQEVYWISEFDSYQNGLNCTAGGQSPSYGEDNPFANYTLEDYKAVVYFMANTDMSPVEISKELEIDRGVINKIVIGESHQYLKEIMPLEYEKMLDRKGSKYIKKRAYPDLRFKDGTIHSLNNLEEFSRLHNLDPGSLSRVIHGHLKSTGGFVLASSPVHQVRAPDDTIYTLQQGMKSEFCQKFGLSESSISHLINGKTKSHKGWTLIK